MKTAALMQCPGDPFVLEYWARNCERVWRDEVDDVLVFVNGQSDPEVLTAIRTSCWRAGADLIHQEDRLVHGDAARILLERCTADTVVLLEDDAFVREPGAIGQMLNRIGEGETDVIGTPRGGMDPAIERYARELFADYDLQSPHGADSGPGLWPCFLFARPAHLLATSRQFASRSWRAGERIPGIGYSVPRDGMTTDTFTTTAFELRGPHDLGGLGLRISPAPQHKELWDKEIPARGAPWFHAGGLSTGDFVGGAFGECGGGGARPSLAGSNEGLDWAHRIWWWGRCVDTCNEVMPDVTRAYRARLEALTDYLDVRGMVDEWTDALLPWITWDERP